MQQRYPHLFQPYRIRKHLFKNRFLAAPLGPWTFSPKNFMFDNAISFFEEMAKGGVASVTIGHTEINDGDEDTDGFGLYFDLRKREGTAAVSEIAHAIQSHGCHASIELNYGGIYSPSHTGVCYGPDEYIAEDGKKIHAMTQEKIDQVVGNYVKCALKMKLCGFDMVTVHGAHGWLPAQFLSMYTNHRTDTYGGSLENRMRLPLQIVKSIREAVGPDMLIEYRISGKDPETQAEEFEDMVAMINAMEGTIDLVHVSSGDGDRLHTFPTYYSPRGTNLDLAWPLKKRVNVPVVVVGNISDPEMADKIIASGKADFVAMARPLMADPELPKKAKYGREEDIIPCLSCYKCLDTMHGNHFLGCEINPRTGRGRRVGPVEKADEVRNVAIIGGGPAGIQAAMTAADRGHKVTLFEKSATLGGLLKITENNTIKDRLNMYLNYLVRQVEKRDVDLRMNTEATPEMIENMGFDAVIVASGSLPAVPPVPGVDSDKVFNCIEAHASVDKLGQSIVIIGGNMVGCETALFMQSLGKSVTVIEMTGKLHADANEVIARMLDILLVERGIHCMTNARCAAIGDTVSVETPDGRVELPADSVVLAAGMKSQYQTFEDMLPAAPYVVPVGDCIFPGTVRNTSRTAYFAARDL